MEISALFGCGNCVYIAMWQRFPPIASWVIILPIWFLVLSFIRTGTGKPLAGIPNVLCAIPLIVAVVFISPGAIGPPLGFWIPISCVAGTWAGLHKHWNTPLAKTLLVVTGIATSSLFLFGTLDYLRYNRMPVAEKQRFVPCWEILKQREQRLRETTSQSSVLRNHAECVVFFPMDHVGSDS